jgi:hypothetical protein
MSSKKPSFKDILRNSFPVNVDGLLGGGDGDNSKGQTISEIDTVSPFATVSKSDTVSFSATVDSLETAEIPEQVKLTSNYFLMDADVFDVLPMVQTPLEQAIYLHLYRQSYGRNCRTCFAGLKTLTEICRLSKNTVRKALESLEKKGHIQRVERLNNRNHKGTLYRIHLPCEMPGLQSQTTFKVTKN